MIVVIAVILAFVIGFVCSRLYFNYKMKQSVIGFLRIDRSIPEDPPHLFLELESSVQSLDILDYVVLKVKSENYISSQE